MTRHVDAETLARYREGDLHVWRAWRVRVHLSRCAECSEVSVELTEVTTLLASVPEPPMPDYLSARIQGVLAHEAALRGVVDSSIPHPASATAQPPAQETATPTERDLGPARRKWPARRWVPRWSGFAGPVALRVVTVAAALVGIVFGSYEVAVHTGSSSSPSAGHRISAPARVAAPAVYGPPLHYQRSGQSESVTPVTTNTDFTAGQLASQVSGLTSHAASPASGPNRSASPPLPRSSGPTFHSVPVTNMSGCVNRIAAGALVIWVDVARFQGTPALVILTQVSLTSPEHIWVVSTACSATSSDILDQGVLPAGS